MDISTDGATLDTNLADLSPEAVGLIFDLVDARSLFRVLHSGCHRLNTKIYTSVRRFDLAYSHVTRFARWPKHLNSFKTLEHVSVRSTDHFGMSLPAFIYEVDLLALPSTLRVLNLLFANDLFCLVTLPPLSYVGGPFTPMLRPELKNKFTNLESLSWGRNLYDEWNMEPWKQAISSWIPSCPFWTAPTARAYKSLLEASQLPSTTSSLDLRLNVNEPPPTTRQLPASLEILRLHPAQPVGATWVCKQLTVSDLGFLPSLKHLTDLEFPARTMDTQLVSMLPRSLKILHISTSNAELESLALLPPELTHLSVNFDVIFSSTTGNSLTQLQLIDNDGLPDSFLPCMREVVVKKLPTKLERISQSLWSLIRPKDWDVFPSKNTASCGFDTIARLSPSQLPYVFHLLRKYEVLEITSGCTPQVAAMLPRHLSGLRLHLLSSEWNLPHAPGSVEESEAACSLIRAIFDGISQLHMLEKLVLLVDETFNLDCFHHLNAPFLRNMRISHQPIEDGIRIRTESNHATENTWEIPSCFARLYRLTVDFQTLAAFYDAMPHILQSSTELLHLLAGDAGDEAGLFSPSWLPFLPPKLEGLFCAFDNFDHATIKALPRTLYRLIVYPTGVQTEYDLLDLFDLPPRLCHASLPQPRGDPLSKDAIIAILDEIAKFYVYDISFVIGGPQGASRHAPQPPIAAILAGEHHSRSISNNDDLDPPSTRMKRRAGE